MFRNYLIVIVRRLFKNWASSLVNIIGLAVGMTAFILIIQYARYEFSYDDFHEKGDRTYRIQQDRYNNGELTTQWAAGCSAIGQALFENFPEIEDFTRFQKSQGVFSYGSQKFKEEEIYIADTSFFKVFSFNLLRGDPYTILRDPFTLVISESTAKKYFGDKEPIGKSMQFDGNPQRMVITGIFSDVPRNSHLKPDFVASWAGLVKARGEATNTDWFGDGYFNYILLNSATNYKEFNARIPAFVEAEIGEILRHLNTGVVFNLQPLSSIHLNSNFMFEAEPNGNVGSVHAFLLIAIFLMIIAWINYINLSTSRALERAREVGMRKVTGAFKEQLLGQFLLESVLINLVAFILSVILVFMLSKFFNMLIGEQLDYSVHENPLFWGGILLVFLFGAVLSGIYPSLLFSSFKPTTIVQGVSGLKFGGYGLRRILVILQFAASLCLTACTLTVYLQITFMKNYDLEVDIDNILVLKGPTVDFPSYRGSYNAFKSELISFPGIENFTASTVVPGKRPHWNVKQVRRLSEGPDKGDQYRIIGIDHNFLDVYELTILEGRNFSAEFGDNTGTVLINEKALKLMGFENLESAMIEPILIGDDTLNIVGIFKNYHQEGLRAATEPLIFRFFRTWRNFYSIKIDPLKIQGILKFIEEQWWTFFPQNPFEYFFLEDYYNAQYTNEIKFSKIFSLFTFLAIFIASLGLYGFSSYTTLQRTREIGIRKTLGSTSGNAVLLLIRYFLIQVLIAIPIGLGSGYYLMSNWIKNFAYHISIGWWFFWAPLFLVILIVILTCSFRVLKTASLNPSETLRYE